MFLDMEDQFIKKKRKQSLRKEKLTLIRSLRKPNRKLNEMT